MSEKICDNKSVGVIIECNDRYLLIERAKFPLGFAAVAGHVDKHGDYLSAALVEVKEEVGISLTEDQLELVAPETRIENQCRRVGGTHHDWVIYKASIGSIDVNRSQSETKSTVWVTTQQLAELASKTLDESLPEEKRLELVWVDFFKIADVI